MSKDPYLEKDPYSGLRAKPLLEAIDQGVYEGQEKFKRAYVGASGIGESCLRKVQLQFRHCTENNFPSSTLVKFDDGHRSEAIYIERISKTKYRMQSDADGEQIGFVDLGGWFRGHRDGFFYEMDFLDNEAAIWEHKSSEKWKDLHKLVLAEESTALRSWNLNYFVQAQLYMHYAGVKYHVLTCSGAGSRYQTAVVTEYDDDAFKLAKHNAHQVIVSDSLLPKISDNPDFYKCKMCDAREVCHTNKLPKPNCRNCAALDFRLDGDRKAFCGVHQQFFEGHPEALENTYECHLYLPELIHPNALTDGIAQQSKKGLTYKYDGIEFTNGRFENAYKSKELYEMGLDVLENKGVSNLTNAFDGKFELKAFK